MTGRSGASRPYTADAVAVVQSKTRRRLRMLAAAMPVVIAHKMTFLGLFGLDVNREFHYPKYFSMVPTGGPDPAGLLAAALPATPAGTVSPKESLHPTDILVVNKRGGAYTLWGSDVELRFRLLERFSASASYSWTSNDTVPDVQQVERAVGEGHHLPRLPRGLNRRRDDLERLVDELHGALRSAFESEQYRATREAMDDELRKQRDALLDAFGFAKLQVHYGEMSPPDHRAREPCEVLGIGRRMAIVSGRLCYFGRPQCVLSRNMPSRAGSSATRRPR